MIDSAFAWMADHPWSVGLLISATVLLVAFLETPGV